MSIFVSEPGRPVGTRLPEALRRRRVGDVTEPVEIRPIAAGKSGATGAEFRQGTQTQGYRALQEYGTAASGERREQRTYLPITRICSAPVHTIPASASVAQALATMENLDIRHLVVEAEGEVAGLIDQRWLLSWVHRHGSAALDQSLTHIELPAFLTATPETDAHQVARLMLAHQLNAALVVDERGNPDGIVTSTDYLKLYASAGQQRDNV